MNAYAEVLLATAYLREALDRLYAARDTHRTVVSQRQLDRLTTEIESCDTHEALASVRLFGG